MNTNAPKKIYLHIRPNKEIGSTWHGNKISDTDIEYTCTDVFIEKACAYLESIGHKYVIGGFRNYMKGE